MEFTASTTGPPAVNSSGVTEQGDTTMRWNRSRWTPVAMATAALMGSACDTATTVPPGCAPTIRSSSFQMRSCISANDSPPGKRNPDGWFWTSDHSGSLRRSDSLRPVHSPKSHSSSPLARWTLSPVAEPIGAAVSRVRSSGEA